jgi:hypothetical protein
MAPTPPLRKHQTAKSRMVHHFKELSSNMRRRIHACHMRRKVLFKGLFSNMRRRIHACHMRRRIHACHMRRRIHACQ